MGSFSIWHWLIVLAVVLILFGGGGKISRIMSDMAHGVKAFKKGLKEDDEGHGDEGGGPKTIASAGTAASASAASSPEPAVRRDDSARG